MQQEQEQDKEEEEEEEHLEGLLLGVEVHVDLEPLQPLGVLLLAHPLVHLSHGAKMMPTKLQTPELTDRLIHLLAEGSGPGERLLEAGGVGRGRGGGGGG